LKKKEKKKDKLQNPVGLSAINNPKSKLTRAQTAINNPKSRTTNKENKDKNKQSNC
jgi:hypothetical protein